MTKLLSRVTMSVSHEQIFDDNRCKRDKKKERTIDYVSGRVKHP
jgi:hypothetical protein